MSLVFAHRGASGYAPENTLEAFRLAMEMGADGFELDVHVTKDGELVVIHDEAVNRTTNGKGLVKDMTLAELKELDACKSMEAYRGAKIPTLAEVYELVKDTNHIVNVEIKSDNYFYPEIEEKCLALAKEMGMEDRVIYSSFNHYTLLKLHELKPDAKLGMLFGDVLYQPWEYAKSLHVQYLHPRTISIFTPEFSTESHKAGYGINVWTVNDEDTMLECLKQGANIITNYPDVAIALRDRK
jgi:glycerophosphoryl diester phosphodiesterase